MILVHVARIGVFDVDATGTVRRKDDPLVTFKQVMNTSIDHRVIPDANIVNTAAYPTIKTYLELEAAADYVLAHLDQSFVITYKRTSTGGYASS